MENCDQILYRHLVEQITRRVTGDISLSLASYSGTGINANMILQGVLAELNKLQGKTE